MKFDYALRDRLEDTAAQYEYVMDPERALEFLDSLEEGELIAFDLETTGLDPTFAKVRLSQWYNPERGVVILDHLFCGDFNKLARRMLAPTLIVYNAKFEGRWFEKARASATVFDVDFLQKAVQGGFPSSLAMLVRRVLKIELDKSEQLSDWSQEELTGSQLNYAALDPVVTYEVFSRLRDDANEGHINGAWTFNECVPAVCECEDTGLTLDIEYHRQNIKTWKMKQEIALRRLRRITPVSMLENPGSDKQVSDFLLANLPKEITDSWPRTDAKQQLKLSRPIAGPIAAKATYPFSRWLNALLRFRYYRKYLSTYGETLITKQELDSKITYRLNIAQAATGRFSSSSINIQNIPRAPWVRRAFLPPEGYKYLVVADYSGIEVRVLAELAKDTKLLEDAVYGNVHAASASAVYHLPEDYVLEVLDDENHAQHADMKEKRSRAKGFTFQNIYGAQAPALSVVLKCSVAEAEEALRGWAKRYPNAYNYRTIMFDIMNRTRRLPICDGREVFVPKSERSMPVAANYPIQGAAASVMCRAMHHIRQMRDASLTRDQVALCASVHDEMVLAAQSDEYVPAAKKLLEDGMKQGWLDVFPDTTTDNLVEAKHGLTWGDAK